MQREGSRKQLRLALQSPYHARSQFRIAVEPQHQVCHARRTLGEREVLAFVLPEVSRYERVRQRRSLPQTQPDAFAGDCVHAAGSISYESDVSVLHAAQRVHGRDCASFTAGGFREGNFFSYRRELAERSVERCVSRMARNHPDANLIRRHGSHVSLRVCAPVNFDVAGPWLNAKVTPGRVALSNLLRCDSAPAPHPRALSVRADDPTSRDSGRRQLHIVTAYRHNGPPPQKLHTAIFGTRDEALVQGGSAHSDAGAQRKITRD